MAIEGRGLIVTADSRREVFAGAEYALVAGEVDGVRGEASLVTALDGRVSTADAERAIAELRDAGVLVPRDDALAPPEAGYWARDGVAPRQAADRLAAVRVAVAVEGDVDDGPLGRAALRRA